MTNFYADEDALDDLIEQWHLGAGGSDKFDNLHEWLGWTLEEYDNWLRTGRQPGEPLD